MNSTAYIFTIGPGSLSRQGLYLLKSINRNTEAGKEDVFVYIVDGEKDNIEDDIINEVGERATLIEGPMPNKNYPLSAAHGALKKASEVSDHEYLVLLDTDIVVLDDITIHEENEAELFVAPEVISHQFWASKDKSEDLLRDVFEKYGFDYPDIAVDSNYDRTEINPYYNSGVIITKNNDFPERYLELSREIHGNLPEKNYNSDMISLSLLAQDYDLFELPPQYNFFQAIRPYPQEGTKVVHYVDLRALRRGVILSRRISSGWFADKLEGTGVLKDIHSMSKLKLFIDSLLEINVAYNRRIKGRELLNFKVRKILIRGLEITRTKQLARDVANWVLGKEKFKEKNY